MKVSKSHPVNLRTLSLLALLLTICSVSTLRAGNLYVPNFSFESQVADFGPFADEWQISPQPSYFPTNSDIPWIASMGLFENTPATNFDHINNADGNQLGYLFADPQVAMFQDNNTVASTGAPATHAFNVLFQPGKTYTLTVALTSSTDEPLTQGSPLQLSLYYRDASNNMVIVASNTVIFDTNVFTNLANLIDFSVTLPGVQTNDAWAGKNIGIQFASTVGFDNAGGVWDLDNVRLTENIYVPNFSFESQVADFGPFADEWQISPQPSYFPPDSDIPWIASMGLFENTPATNFDHINNADGNQLGYIFADPQVAMLQDNNTVASTGAPATHAFNVLYQPGKYYTLTVGLTSSSDEPLTQGSPLQLDFYYRDASSNMIIIASNTVLFDTNVFTNLDNLIDFSVTLPAVKATDSWAGKNIGIQFVSTVGFDIAGGVWDLDNVRLEQFVATALQTPALTSNQFGFSVVAEPNLHFEVLTSTNLNQTNWTSIGTFTNVTGTLAFTDTNAVNGARYYQAHQLP